MVPIIVGVYVENGRYPDYGKKAQPPSKVGQVCKLDPLFLEENMSTFKRILGFLGIGLGTIGLTLCLAVIIGAWWVNSPITYRLLYQVFPPIEAALAFGETTVAEFTDFIADTQTQITTVTDARPVVTALEDEMQQVAVYVDVAYAVSDSVDQVATGLAGADRPGQAGNVVAHSAARLSEVLHEATGTLDAAQTLAEDIGNGRNDKIDALNEQLDTLQLRSAEIETAIEQTESDVAVIKSKVPRWVNIGSLIVTLLFIWFGVAQYFLLRNCWQYLRYNHG